MDMYGYFLSQFKGASNPYAAMERCEGAVADMADNPHIPTCATIAVAADLLAAVTDFAGNGCAVSASFRRVRQLVADVCRKMQSACQAEDSAWYREQCGMNGIPPYEPSDYEVRDEDLDGEDTDGIDDEPGLSELYGDGGESGSTGTSRHWPDWENIGNWTASDWVMMQTYKDKIMAAAECGFMGVSSVTGVLSAAKEAINMVPLTRQVELCVWAQDVVDCLIFSMEDDLQKMCAGSLHSHEGRLVQKQLFQKQLLGDTTEHH